MKLENISSEINPAYPKRYRHILSQGLNQEQIQRECAYWLLEPEHWDDLQPRTIPIKPQQAIDYEELDQSVKQKMKDKGTMRDYMLDHPEAARYYAEITFTNYYNQLKAEQLQQLMKHILEDDQDAKQKYMAKISQFGQQGVINKEHIPEEMQLVMEEFGGKVVED